MGKYLLILKKKYTMQIRILFFILFLSISSQLLAQDNNFLLFGEGREDVVRLFWTPKTWPDNLTGFDVKRRVVNNRNKGDWQLLNATVIFPESSLTKDISNVEKNPAQQQRLVEKRQQLITDKTLFEIPNEKYIELVKDKNNLIGLSIALGRDYDIALLSGFGLVDRNIPEAKGYEYGLFPRFNDVSVEAPVSTYTWEYGSKPETVVKMEASYKVGKSKKQIEVTWVVDVKSYKEHKTLNGFNIYRKSDNTGTKKLNDTPIWINTKEDKGILFYKDTDINDSTVYTYSAVPVTIFNTEWSGVEMELNLADTPKEIEPPKLDDKSQGSNSKREFLFEWDFKAENEKFIEGFVMERKKQKDSLFISVSNILPASQRSFIDNQLPAPDGNYYHYRLSAVVKEGTNLWSNRILIYNKENKHPTAPRNLSGEIITEGDQKFIALKWEGSGDTNAIKGYKLYSSLPPDTELSWLGNIPLITDTEYKYEIYYTAGEYNLAVSSINTDGEESDLSPIISIFSPSRFVPAIRDWTIIGEDNKVNFKWKYNEELPDLEGFRIYLNGNLAVDESKLKSDVRQWAYSLDNSGNYSFEIVAITRFGIESKKSLPKTTSIN
jgi:hypothetical protein